MRLLARLTFCGGPFSGFTVLFFRPFTTTRLGVLALGGFSLLASLLLCCSTLAALGFFTLLRLGLLALAALRFCPLLRGCLLPSLTLSGFSLLARLSFCGGAFTALTFLFLRPLASTRLSLLTLCGLGLFLSLFLCDGALAALGLFTLLRLGVSALAAFSLLSLQSLSLGPAFGLRPLALSTVVVCTAVCLRLLSLPLLGLETRSRCSLLASLAFGFGPLTMHGCSASASFSLSGLALPGGLVRRASFSSVADPVRGGRVVVVAALALPSTMVASGAFRCRLFAMAALSFRAMGCLRLLKLATMSLLALSPSVGVIVVICGPLVVLTTVLAVVVRAFCRGVFHRFATGYGYEGGTGDE